MKREERREIAHILADMGIPYQRALKLAEEVPDSLLGVGCSLETIVEKYLAWEQRERGKLWNGEN